MFADWGLFCLFHLELWGWGEETGRRLRLEGWALAPLDWHTPQHLWGWRLLDLHTCTLLIALKGDSLPRTDFWQSHLALHPKYMVWGCRWMVWWGGKSINMFRIFKFTLQYCLHWILSTSLYSPCSHCVSFPETHSAKALQKPTRSPGKAVLFLLTGEILVVSGHFPLD